MKPVFKNIIIFLALLITDATAFAKTDSLQVYMRLAAENNPTVRQRFKEYEAALQKVPQVRSLPDPQLEMGVFLSPMEIMSGKQVADIKLMQMLPWFGVLKNAKDEMSMMARMKYEIFRDAKLQVFYEVQRNCFDLYRISHETLLTRQNIELLLSIKRISVINFGVASSGETVSSGSKPLPEDIKNATSGSGMGSMNGNKTATTSSMQPGMSSGGMGKSKNSGGLIEVYEIESELTELENSLVSLQNEKKVTTAKLNALLGRNENIDVSILDTLTAESLDISYLSVNDSIFKNNPMTSMLVYEQQSLDSRLLMQKKMGLPMVGIGLNYSVIAGDPMSGSSMNGKDMIMPMVSVSLPIYRKKYEAMQKETKLMKEASEENSKATRNELYTAYLEALRQYSDSENLLKLYEKQKSLLGKSLSVSLNAYSTGLSTLSEIQSLRRRLLDYDLKYIKALVDFNTAKALVMRLVAITDF
jgi:outer membrane protein TolC